MRRLLLLANQHFWTSVLVSPIIFTLVPGVVIWAWPGDPPGWGPMLGGIIALLAYFAWALVIGIGLRYASRRYSVRSENTLALVWRSTDEQLPAQCEGSSGGYSTDLALLLSAAKSVRDFDERDRALKTVAETAVEQENFFVAIKAAAACPHHDARSSTLRFVAQPAAKAGQLNLAAEAAKQIPHNDVQGRAMNEILKIERDRR